MIKYLVIPGWVRTKERGNYEYFLSSSVLIQLYGVRREECHIFNSEYDKYKNFTGLIPLTPRYDENYSRMPMPIIGE